MARFCLETGEGHQSAWSAPRALATLLSVALVLVASVQAEAPPRPATRGGSSSEALWQQVVDENSGRASEKSDEEREALFWVAVATANLGRLEDSRKAFERLEAADPQRVTATRVAQTSRAILAQTTDDLVALNGVAFVAYAQGNYAEAARSFREVVRLDPHNPWPRGYLGFSLGKDGQLDEAVMVLQEGVRVFPENEVLHFLLGLAYYHKGQVLRAVVEMAKAPRAIRYFR